MWELDYKESWVPKNWCFWTVVLEKTLESPLGCKEIQPVHPKGDQSWIFNGRTDAKAETPILWPAAVKNWLIWKDPDAGKDWGQEQKGMTEDEMVEWHHRLDGPDVIIVEFSLVAQSCLTLCDPMDCSTPVFPVHHQLPGLAQTHVHQVGDVIQPSHPAFNLS